MKEYLTYRKLQWLYSDIKWTLSRIFRQRISVEGMPMWWVKKYCKKCGSFFTYENKEHNSQGCVWCRSFKSIVPKDEDDGFLDYMTNFLREYLPEKGQMFVIPDPTKLTEHDFKILEEWAEEEED